MPIIALEQAPIAFCYNEYFKGKIEYRLFENKLYTRVHWSDKLCNATGWWPATELIEHIKNENTWSCVREFCGGPLHSPAECEQLLREKYERYLFIQGQEEIEVWEVTGEPRYVIVTFGLGHNHAGTNYFIENSYNPNIRKERYFSALQYKEVVKEALRVAETRGDTESFDRIKAGPKIEVLIPEAVHCKPLEEAGDGDKFLNMLEAATNGCTSAGEAAAIAVAMTLMEM